MPDETTTPGQLAHEAYWRDLGYDTPPISWDRMHPDERHAQEAGAQAAISAGTGKILAEAARYKAERDEARRQLATLELRARSAEGIAGLADGG